MATWSDQLSAGSFIKNSCNTLKYNYLQLFFYFIDEKNSVNEMDVLLSWNFQPALKEINKIQEKFSRTRNNKRVEDRCFMDKNLAVFEDYKIRRVYDEKADVWYFSVVDIIQVLIQQTDYQTARKYWNKLKERLKKEGSQSVTKCHQLKLEAADGKKYLTDVATAETLLRLVQSVPSPKAEPIKLWLAKVGYERTCLFA